MKFLILNSLDNHADLVRVCKKNVAIVAGSSISARTARFFQISPLKLVNSHLIMFVCVYAGAHAGEDHRALEGPKGAGRQRTSGRG